MSNSEVYHSPDLPPGLSKTHMQRLQYFAQNQSSYWGTSVGQYLNWDGQWTKKKLKAEYISDFSYLL